MKKGIIFGCSDIGKAVYRELKEYYDIIAWVDDNQDLHGQEIDGISVIGSSEIPLLEKKYDLDVFVSVFCANVVVEQLRKLGVSNIYSWKGGFFFSADGLYPLEFPAMGYHKKDNNQVMHILFISDAANVQIHRMASLVKRAGEKVFLAYIIRSPYEEWEEYTDIYEEIYPIMSMHSLFDFAKNSEFDIIHCSNELDYMTSILIHSGKTVIHDCHDLPCSSQSMSPDKLTVEYLAHTGAAGVIYPTVGLRDEAVKKFALVKERTLVIENYLSEDLQQKGSIFENKVAEQLLKFYGIVNTSV